MNSSAAVVAATAAREAKVTISSTLISTALLAPPATDPNAYRPLPPERRRRTPHNERVPLLDALIARAEARAILVDAGEFDLHEAVDGLQTAAVVNGLVDCIGQDTVQAIFADAFEPPSREPPPIGCTGGGASAGELHAAIERDQQRHGEPQVTVDALYWAYAEGGPSALQRPENQDRLGRLSRAQLIELRRRIERIAK